jgi:hypothetical protein
VQEARDPARFVAVCLHESSDRTTDRIMLSEMDYIDILPNSGRYFNCIPFGHSSVNVVIKREKPAASLDRA